MYGPLVTAARPVAAEAVTGCVRGHVTHGFAKSNRNSIQACVEMMSFRARVGSAGRIYGCPFVRPPDSEWSALDYDEQAGQ